MNIQVDRHLANRVLRSMGRGAVFNVFFDGTLLAWLSYVVGIFYGQKALDVLFTVVVGI